MFLILPLIYISLSTTVLSATTPAKHGTRDKRPATNPQAGAANAVKVEIVAKVVAASGAKNTGGEGARLEVPNAKAGAIKPKGPGTAVTVVGTSGAEAVSKQLGATHTRRRGWSYPNILQNADGTVDTKLHADIMINLHDKYENEPKLSKAATAARITKSRLSSINKRVVKSKAAKAKRDLSNKYFGLNLPQQFIDSSFMPVGTQSLAFGFDSFRSDSSFPDSRSAGCSATTGYNQRVNAGRALQTTSISTNVSTFNTDDVSITSTVMGKVQLDTLRLDTGKATGLSVAVAFIVTYTTQVLMCKGIFAIGNTDLGYSQAQRGTWSEENLGFSQAVLAVAGSTTALGIFYSIAKEFADEKAYTEVTFGRLDPTRYVVSSMIAYQVAPASRSQQQHWMLPGASIIIDSTTNEVLPLGDVIMDLLHPYILVEESVANRIYANIKGSRRYPADRLYPQFKYIWQYPCLEHLEDIGLSFVFKGNPFLWQMYVEDFNIGESHDNPGWCIGAVQISTSKAYAYSVGTAFFSSFYVAFSWDSNGLADKISLAFKIQP